MRSSEDRILTTPVASLPRGPAVADLLVAKENGEAIDEARLAALVRAGIQDVVKAQLDAGVDIGNDGEMPRTTFVDYVSERIRGFARGSGGERPLPLDAQRFPLWFGHVEHSSGEISRVRSMQIVGKWGHGRPSKPWSTMVRVCQRGP